MNGGVMIVKFLSVLFEKCYGFVEIRKIRNGQVQAEFFDLKQLSGIPIKRLGQENLDGWNIYFGVCPRNQKKGRRENVKQIPALWADVDAKECGGDMESALRQIENLPESLKPSIIINSGNGYHCYWTFESPVIIKTNTDADQIQNLNKRIAAVIGGDHVGDLPRILRLPGTFNVKDPKNRKSCKIITFEPERKFRIENFDSLPDAQNENNYIAGTGNEHPADKNATGQTNKGKDTKDDNLDREAKWVTRALWGAKEGKRNQTLARLAGYFKNHHPKDVTQNIVMLVASRCNPPLPQNEVGRIVDSIYRYNDNKNGQDPVVKLKIVQTEPPYYLVRTKRGKEFAVNVDDLTSFGRFKKAYITHTNSFPSWTNAKNWEKYVDNLLANAEIEEAPDDASEEQAIFEIIQTRVMNEAKDAKNIAEYHGGNVIRREDGVYFASQAVWQHLRDKGINMNKNEIYRVLRSRGCRSGTVRFDSNIIRGWILPYETREDAIVTDVTAK